MALISSRRTTKPTSSASGSRRRPGRGEAPMVISTTSIARVALAGLLALGIQAAPRRVSASGAGVQAATPSAAPLRLAIAGLVHGHVTGFLRLAQARTDVQIVGVFDPDEALRHSYAQRYKLADDIFFADMATMLDRVKPDAVAAFTSTYDHPIVVEAAAARHLTVMMEKPLAVSTEHARRIERAAARGGIQVLVNYETTWYANHGTIWTLMKERAAGGAIRKIVALDGHQGPKKINVQPEFFAWLTDPIKNGAGALFDFGCYGANLMTWLLDNERPIAVTTLAQHFQPDVYPRVEDEATVLVEYAKAQGLIQASWNWPFNRKDLEVYAERGAAFAGTGGSGL